MHVDGFCTEPTLFAILKNRVGNQVRSHGGWQGLCDEGLEGILTALNAHSGIATVYSCASHSDDESPAQCYFLMAIQSEGLAFLMLLLDRLQDALVAEGYSPCHLNLLLGRSVTRVNTDEHTTVKRTYRRATLEIHLAGPSPVTSPAIRARQYVPKPVFLRLLETQLSAMV